MKLIAGLIFAVALTGATPKAATPWKVEKTVDKFTDKASVRAAAIGSDNRLLIILECASGGEMSIMFGTVSTRFGGRILDRSGLREIPIRARVDSRPMFELAPLGMLEAAPMYAGRGPDFDKLTTEMLAGTSKLIVSAPDIAGGFVDDTFNLQGFKPVASEVISACKAL